MRNVDPSYHLAFLKDGDYIRLTLIALVLDRPRRRPIRAAPRDVEESDMEAIRARRAVTYA